MDPLTTEGDGLEAAGGGGTVYNNRSAVGGGRGRGHGEAGGKAWQQEGDWPCPNPSCTNVNFAFRGVCNRCGAARPAGAGSGGGGGFGGGRGKGRRGGADGGDHGRGPGGPPGLFGPNDWTCPMCENINWAKRTKCNVCNTTKPGLKEGGVREGRAGGYKELDEAEMEETKRRRKVAEDNDGEMYDEFGNLKKKFRVKAKEGEAGAASQQAIVGKAGWANEDIGVLGREKSRERATARQKDGGEEGCNGYQISTQQDEYSYGGSERSRERDRHQYGYSGEGLSDSSWENYRGRGRSRERDREWASDRGRGKERDHFRDTQRERERDGGWSRDRERGRERFVD